jgi:hypothetical protein
VLQRPFWPVLTASALIGGLALAGCGGSSGPTRSRFELVPRRSSCQSAQRTVRCSIGVRNIGTSPGRPTVWAYYFFSDTFSSFDYSRNGECPGAGSIRPGRLGFVFFCHANDATHHLLTQVAASLDENATSYSYVRVAPPDDANWPHR